MWQAYSCIERTPSKYIWKSPLRSCVNQIAVPILLFHLVPCAPRYQIGSGAMVSSQYYPEPNDDVDSVPPHETSLAIDAEVVNEFIEDSKNSSDAHSQVLTFNTDVVTKVKDILNFYLESVKILLTLVRDAEPELDAELDSDDSDEEDAGSGFASKGQHRYGRK